MRVCHGVCHGVYHGVYHGISWCIGDFDLRLQYIRTPMKIYTLFYIPLFLIRYFDFLLMLLSRISFSIFSTNVIVSAIAFLQLFIQ